MDMAKRLQMLWPKERPIRAAAMSPITKKRIDVIAILGNRLQMAPKTFHQAIMARHNLQHFQKAAHKHIRGTGKP